MDYPAYPVYRESGIEWLGKIPDHWEVKRLKYAFQLLTEKTERKDNPVGLENIEGWSGRFIETDSEFQGDGVAFEQGDILFGKLRPYLAKVHLAQFAGEAVGDFHVLRPIGEIIGIFGLYQCLNKDFITNVDSSTYGAKMPRVSWEYMANMLLVFPSLTEQRKISAFLDHKTQQIDQLISKKQTLIDKLNEQRIALITHAVTKGLNPAVTLKDSGVEWLGEVPKHWDVVRLRYITEKITSGSRGWAQYFADEGEQFLRITNLSRKSISLLEDDMRRVNPPEGTEGERTKTQDGDILVSITADLGSIAVIPENYEASYVSQHIALIRPEPKQFDSKWIAYCLFSHAGKAQLLGAGYGGTKVQLGLADIKEVYIPIPPLLEQTKIIEQLVEQIDRLDRMIDLNQQTIDKLKEYRTALITAAVTGKIDLRNWQQEANHANP